MVIELLFRDLLDVPGVREDLKLVYEETEDVTGRLGWLAGQQAWLERGLETHGNNNRAQGQGCSGQHSHSSKLLTVGRTCGKNGRCSHLETEMEFAEVQDSSLSFMVFADTALSLGTRFSHPPRLLSFSVM